MRQDRVVCFVVGRTVFFRLSLRRLPGVVVLREYEVAGVALRGGPSVFVRVRDSRVGHRYPYKVLRNATRALSIVVRSCNLVGAFRVEDVEGFFTGLSRHFRGAKGYVGPFFQARAVYASPSS